MMPSSQPRLAGLVEPRTKVAIGLTARRDVGAEA